LRILLHSLFVHHNGVSDIKYLQMPYFSGVIFQSLYVRSFP
jgi:hypothetical protein